VPTVPGVFEERRERKPLWDGGFRPLVASCPKPAPCSYAAGFCLTRKLHWQ